MSEENHKGILPPYPKRVSDTSEVPFLSGWEVKLAFMEIEPAS